MVPVTTLDSILDRPPALRTLFRFVVWMVQTDPRRAIASLLLQFTAGLLPAATVWIVRSLFDQSLDVYRGALPVTAMLTWIGLWAAVMLAETAIRTLSRTVLLEGLKQEMEDRLLEQLQRKASSLRLEVFERADFHDVLRRAQEAATPGYFLNLLGEIYTLLTGSIAAVSVAIMVGFWDPVLLVAIVLVSLPPPIARTIQGKNYFAARRGQTERERLRGYLDGLLTRPEAAKEVRVFGLAPVLLDWWAYLYWRVADRLFRQRRAHHAVDGSLSALSLMGLAAGIGWSAWTVAEGGLSPGQFAAMMVALREVRFGVDRVAWRLGFLANRLLTIADLFIYLDLGPERPAAGYAVEGLGKIPIVAKGVSFRYPQADRLALEDITCTIQPGTRVALVGANGSGKTTLVKVLLGLFTPMTGEVRYGGRDSSSVEGELWDQSAAVFQDYTRFAFSLGENIGFGRTERMNEPAEVERAAREGGADVIADQLPDGYGTLLTREFTGGTELSGGEWQRVAISRGCMRNASLVVLDEPTASLDPQAEAEIFRRFLSLAEGRTTLVVSHRLGSARLCDQILVLNDGCLVERGTHDELIEKQGEYARMWQLQAQWYGAQSGTPLS